jgi:hypothetical protein
MNRHVIVLFTSTVFVFPAHADAPQGPSKEVPELQILNHWVGKWDVDLTVKPNADLPKGRHAQGTAKAEWVLMGRFLQQTGTLEASDGLPAIQVHSLMTYDPGKKVYRTWMFFSTGFVSESEGTWDEKTRTLTSTGRNAESGITTTTKASFAEDGSESWSMISKNGDGKVVAETNGKNTPRKK